jgi:Protein of unknown function (DUF4245)
MVDVATDKKRGTEVIADMLRSLAVVGVVIVPLWLLIPHHTQQHVTVIDYSTALRQAERVSSQQVVAPSGLPATWRATSVSLSGGDPNPVVFHLGFVTPAGDYAALEESNGPRSGYLTTLLGKTPKALPDVPVGAVAWRSLRDTNGRVALVSPSTPMTVVVTGTARLSELTTLAASVH